MEEKKLIDKKIVHLARLALSGRRQDVLLFLRKTAKQYKSISPQLANELNALIHESPSLDSPIRGASIPNVPVDLDSRLQLLRVEHADNIEFDPIFSKDIEKILQRILIERQREKDLTKEGLLPTKSLLFTGPPGVGKTLAAKWLAYQLHWPLLTLDLSAVISSFLGRTGSNVRMVLDYAKSIKCVLFLDELDAIAKRRDDIAEIGELKRLVTVLLQEIEDWPPSGILIAATNHPDLLDPAIWRRFDVNLQFEIPNEEQTNKAIKLFLGNKVVQKSPLKILNIILKNHSYNDIERTVLNIRRDSVVRNISFQKALADFIQRYNETLNLKEKTLISAELVNSGMSQRQVHEITGTSRDTIRKKIKTK